MKEKVNRGLEPARAWLTAEILAEAARNSVTAGPLTAEDRVVRLALLRLLVALLGHMLRAALTL